MTYYFNLNYLLEVIHLNASMSIIFNTSLVFLLMVKLNLHPLHR